MSRQYNNFRKFFAGSDLVFVPTLDEYLKNRRVIFRCANGHMNDLNPDSFKNKRARLDGEPIEKLCIRCENDQDAKDEQKFEERKAKILANSGHVLLEVGKGRSCIYECKNCGTKNKSFLANIETSLGFCPSCQNTQFIKNREEAEKEIYELSEYKVVEYTNSHNIKFRCSNGHEYIDSLTSIRRGRRCPECSPERRAETNLKRFGAENPFASEIIKEKIRTTNMERYGVHYPLQNEEIKRKVVDTCMKKFGVKFAFVQPWVFDKIRNTMMEKYGAEYPLQVPELFRKALRSSFSNKEIILPITKRSLHVMGFEDIAITRLLSRKNPYLKRNIDESEIIVGENVPIFKYICDDNKQRTYYPDIYIKDTKLLYEIKSIFTFNFDARKNYLKFTQVANDGYILIVLIYETRKRLFDVWIFRPDKSPISKRGKKLKQKIEFDKPIFSHKPRIVFDDSKEANENCSDKILEQILDDDIITTMIDETIDEASNHIQNS